MKLHAKLAVLLIAAAALAMGACAGTRDRIHAPEFTAAGVDFSGVMNRDWILSEIRSAAQTVTLDRAGHAELFGDIFTLRFESAMAFGVAMPNTFRGPYALDDLQGITFGDMAVTMMAAFMEPEELNEHEFFIFLSNAFTWNLEGGNLELHTTAEDGTDTVLIFVAN